MNATDAAASMDHLLRTGKQSSGRAILLNGNWGSGKTFLWKSIVAPKLKRQCLYVSAFGAENPAALKTRLLSEFLVALPLEPASRTR